VRESEVPASNAERPIPSSPHVTIKAEAGWSRVGQHVEQTDVVGTGGMCGSLATCVYPNTLFQTWLAYVLECLEAQASTRWKASRSSGKSGELVVFSSPSNTCSSAYPCEQKVHN
jgi:hypothetical protein